mmetsp:Transcript_44657/g.106210  ORF Transcript_44657/g.106210 Transcript_44657/m.106210 type:complete len:270 (+) Transcript_44657:427-1236(+)
MRAPTRAEVRLRQARGAQERLEAEERERHVARHLRASPALHLDAHRIPTRREVRGCERHHERGAALRVHGGGARAAVGAHPALPGGEGGVDARGREDRDGHVAGAAPRVARLDEEHHRGAVRGGCHRDFEAPVCGLQHLRTRIRRHPRHLQHGMREREWRLEPRRCIRRSGARRQAQKLIEGAQPPSHPGSARGALRRRRLGRSARPASEVQRREHRGACRLRGGHGHVEVPQEIHGRGGRDRRRGRAGRECGAHVKVEQVGLRRRRRR